MNIRSFGPAQRLPRGVFAAPRAEQDPAKILSTMQAGVEAFKAEHRQQMANAQAAVDDVSGRLAALGANGGGVGDGHVSPAAVRAGKEELGTFAKTGALPQAAMSGGSNPDGGYTLQPELETTILQLQRNTSPLRRICRVQPVKKQDYQIPVNLQGTASGWAGETAARPATATPQLGLLDFPAGEIYANPFATQRILDDAVVNVADWLVNEVTLEFDKQEGIGFLAGDGVNKPLGILTNAPAATADATRAFGTYQSIASGAAGAVTADGLINFAFSLKAGYRQNATWLMNSITFSAIRQLKDGQGRYLFDYGSTPRQFTLLGYPVEFDENVPNVAAGTYPILFGDFLRGYLITDRMDLRVLRDPYTNKPYVGFYATKRVGGGPLDTNAIKFLKISAT